MEARDVVPLRRGQAGGVCCIAPGLFEIAVPGQLQGGVVVREGNSGGVSGGGFEGVVRGGAGLNMKRAVGSSRRDAGS